MAHALNLFVPIRQDADSQKLLADIEANFATRDQALIEKAARDSQILPVRKSQQTILHHHALAGPDGF
jgi:hypothetical protein